MDKITSCKRSASRRDRNLEFSFFGNFFPLKIERQAIDGDELPCHVVFSLDTTSLKDHFSTFVFCSAQQRIVFRFFFG